MLLALLVSSGWEMMAWIILIVLLTGGGAKILGALRPADQDRLRRIEHKLGLILTHLGIDYVPPPKSAWQELADDPGQKIAAIKAYREQHSVGLAEAKKAVEDYIQGKSG
jgi:hypothetical protein